MAHKLNMGHSHEASDLAPGVDDVQDAKYRKEDGNEHGEDGGGKPVGVVPSWETFVPQLSKPLLAVGMCNKLNNFEKTNTVISIKTHGGKVLARIL